MEVSQVEMSVCEPVILIRNRNSNNNPIPLTDTLHRFGIEFEVSQQRDESVFKSIKNLRVDDGLTRGA